MNQRQYQRLAGLVRQCAPSVILRAAALCNGHSIFNPMVFHRAGLPEPVIEYFTRTHRSNLDTPKGTIFVGGRPVRKLLGVYGLDLLEFLAEALGVTYARALGRGTQARNIQSALHEHFKQFQQLVVSQNTPGESSSREQGDQRAEPERNEDAAET